MPASLSVRDLEPETIGPLKQRAVAHGRSAAAEACSADLGAELPALTAGCRRPPAGTLLRVARDGR